jgi:chemotaxis signal transduction protein
MSSEDHPSGPTDAEGPLFLLFDAGGETYAIEALHALKVVEPGRISRLPRLPPEVVGVTHHRGRIITVLYLPALLDGSTQASLGAESRILILDLGQRNLGLLADGVHRIDALPLQNLRRPPNVPNRPFGLRGLVDDQGVAVGVLESGPLIEALEGIGDRLQ